MTQRPSRAGLVGASLWALCGLGAGAQLAGCSDPNGPSANEPAGIDAGLCPDLEPLPPFADERGEACWDLPDAPSAEACPSSAAQELGERCCLPGSCAFDFGAGCTAEPQVLVADLDPSAGPCAGGAVEQVLSAELDALSVGRDALFALRDRPDGSQVTRVAKDSCEQRVIYEEPGPLRAIQAVGDTLFVAAGASSERLIAIDGEGAASELSLAELLDAQELGIAALGTDGHALLLLVGYRRNGASDVDYESSLVRVPVPCCDQAPRIVSDALPPLAGGRYQASFDGQSVVFVSVELVLDAGPFSYALRVDASSLAVTPLLDGVRENLLPSALLSGELYIGRGRAITGLAIDGCATRTIASRPEADAITALVAGDGWLYWAERYQGLTGGRILRMRPGAAPERLVQTAQPVEWLGLDDDHLYWREPVPDTASALVARRELPR